MNLVSASTQNPLRCASLSILSSSINLPSHFPSPLLLKPYAPDSKLYSAKLATTNGDARRNFRSPVVAKASITSGYGPEIGEILGDVRIFTAAGEPVLFKDLWDQTEVQSLALVCLFTDHFLCRFFFLWCFCLQIGDVLWLIDSDDGCVFN